MDGEAYRLFWAKTEKADGSVHALVCHSIDVGNCALELWQRALPERTRRFFAEGLQLAEEEAGLWLAFLTSLHDFGKASPPFQQKHPPAIALLNEAGLDFPDTRFYLPHPHGLATAWSVEPLLTEWGMPLRPARFLSAALAGHHGAWPSAADLLSPHRPANLGGPAWDAARRQLFRSLHAAFPAPPGALPQERLARNVFLTLFSGFVSVADWLGSMQEHFPFTAPERTGPDYAALSRRRAIEALQHAGWEQWRAVKPEAGFEELFGFLPYPAQSQAISAAEDRIAPALVILEAPTGSGKTETALYLADRWLHASRSRGVYVAMPTQATSNQMFERVAGFLGKRFSGQLVNLQLAHGQALLSERLADLVLSAGGEDPGEGVAALSWFLPRKRTLLAPFGVGTVDQALLSVLQTRHFFVRLFGLAHKVVIFDEVHAYDTYMSELFWRLLAWLREIGAFVVLLSATLPETTRLRLASAYAGRELQGMPAAPYPRLAVIDAEQARSIPLPRGTERQVALEWWEREPEEISRRLAGRLENGGCAAVICNTIRRAQQVYAHLKVSGLLPPQDCLLFHARFPFAWRMERENQALARFGKGGKRPQKAILVATQVVEQSLDLDFDLMISELAPIDLLIQRAGRLHRHAHRRRPTRLALPSLVLLAPRRTADGNPDFEGDAFVYEPYLLLRTLAALHGKTALAMPEETPTLIEQVYGEAELPAGWEIDPGLLEQAFREMKSNRERESAEARKRLVPPPGHEDLLISPSLGLEEDSPQVHHSLQALTRLSEPGVTLICLHALPGGGLGADPEDPASRVELDRAPGSQALRRLLQSSVNVQHPALVRFFLEKEPPPSWKETPALRGARPVVFTGGICRLDSIPYTLELDREIGLIVRKEAL